MGRNRVILPTSGVDISKAKIEAGNISVVVPVSRTSQVFYKPDGSGKAGRGGFVVHRKIHVDPKHKLGAKAKAMRGCAGKKGCEFKSCLEAAGITAPRSIIKACGSS